MVESKTDLGVKGVSRDIGTLHEVPKVNKVEVSPQTSISPNTSPSTLPLLHPSKPIFNAMQTNLYSLLFPQSSMPPRDAVRLNGRSSEHPVREQRWEQKKKAEKSEWLDIDPCHWLSRVCASR